MSDFVEFKYYVLVMFITVHRFYSVVHVQHTVDLAAQLELFKVKMTGHVNAVLLHRQLPGAIVTAHILHVVRNPRCVQFTQLGAEAASV